jgi:hypothetical protein
MINKYDFISGNAHPLGSGMILRENGDYVKCSDHLSEVNAERLAGYTKAIEQSDIYRDALNAEIAGLRNALEAAKQHIRGYAELFSTDATLALIDSALSVSLSKGEKG